MQINSTVRNHAWRQIVAVESQRFLEKHDLFSDEYATTIHKILQGRPIVRVSHQPNLYASLNIVGLLVWAEKLAKNIDGVVVYVGLDYDDAGDQRFRSALLPPLSGTNLIHMSPMARKYRHRVAYAVPAITGDHLESSLKSYSQSIRRCGAALNLQPHHTSFAVHMRKQLELSQSFVDFNMAYLEWSSRALCTQRMLFVPASAYISPQGAKINQLIKRILEINSTVASRLVWRICPNCLNRTAVSLFNDSILNAQWVCDTCKVGSTEQLDWSKKLPAYSDKSVFIPQVLLCDMIDLDIVQADASVSYNSSKKHLIQAMKTYGQAYSIQQTTRDFIWRPQGMHFVPTDFLHHELWECGKFSTPLYLSLFSIQKIREEILNVPLQILRYS